MEGLITMVFFLALVLFGIKYRIQILSWLRSANSTGHHDEKITLERMLEDAEDEKLSSEKMLNRRIEDAKAELEKLANKKKAENQE